MVMMIQRLPLGKKDRISKERQPERCGHIMLSPSCCVPYCPEGNFKETENLCADHITPNCSACEFLPLTTAL